MRFLPAASVDARDLGLIDALQSECDRFSRLESIPVTVEARDVPEDLPPDTALCLFRIMQEALRNIARHSDATRVDVALWGAGMSLHLTVADNGKGFDPTGSDR